jgi:fatty acid desaturase
MRALDTDPRRAARVPYSARASAGLRLGYFTAALTALGALHGPTGGRLSAYFWLLWATPMMTSFLYFMRLRDVFQHANADAGRLTNSRVFRCGPLTRWAVFIYGQDWHVTHHLVPTVPYHRLPELHSTLMRLHPGYAARVVECHGTLLPRDDRPTVVDALTRPPARGAASAPASRPLA